MTPNSKQRTNRKHRKYRKTKTSFPKEQVENVELYKSVLNKLMTAHE